MGLKIRKEMESGVVVDEAYVRIDTISGYKKSLTISVNYYVSQGAFINSKPYFQQEIYTFIPSVENGSENFIKQGYIAIKKLPNFKGCSDVFEDGQNI